MNPTAVTHSVARPPALFTPAPTATPAAPLPPPAAPLNGQSSTRRCAQHFAATSVAVGLFVLGSIVALKPAGGHHTMPPLFAVIMLVMLLAGVALGIFAVAWNKNPRRRGVLIAGVFGICTNALLLLLISGLASANHGPPPYYSSTIATN